MIAPLSSTRLEESTVKSRNFHMKIFLGHSPSPPPPHRSERVKSKVLFDMNPLASLSHYSLSHYLSH